MTASRNKILIVAVIAVVLLGVYFTVFAAAKPDEQVSSGGTNLDTQPAPDGNTGTGSGANFPLGVGSRNSNVKTWQNYLYTKLHGTTSSGRAAFCDGIFGPNTLAATLKVTGERTVTLAMFLDAVDTAAGGAFAASGGSLTGAGTTAGPDYFQ